MKEINIGRTIINKRKEKNITQEELASYIGVSSASVSKWETGQSYPDILLLPQLATYFNVTMDELMGYEPQLTKKEIGKIYHRLYQDFSTKPLDEVLEECRELIRKYYSCFPLLLQLGDLLLIASVTTDNKEKSAELIVEAKELFIRVKTESTDSEIMNAALYFEAMCAASQQDYEEIIRLLEKTDEVWHPREVLLSSAYQMTGRAGEAERVLQIAIFQHITSLIGLLSSHMSLSMDKGSKFDEIVKRTHSIIDSFNIKKIQPSLIISFYGVAAQGYLMNQEEGKSIDMLEHYTEIATGGLSTKFEGDEFFNLVANWYNEYITGDGIVPNEMFMKSMVDAIVDNPAFSQLEDNPRFQEVVKKLKD